MSPERQPATRRTVVVMTRPATIDSPRRRAGKALVALSYPPALGLPLWTLPFDCGEDLNPLNGAVLFASPLLLLGGFLRSGTSRL